MTAFNSFSISIDGNQPGWGASQFVLYPLPVRTFGQTCLFSFGPVSVTMSLFALMRNACALFCEPSRRAFFEPWRVEPPCVWSRRFRSGAETFNSSTQRIQSASCVFYQCSHKGKCSKQFSVLSNALIFGGQKGAIHTHTHIPGRTDV